MPDDPTSWAITAGAVVAFVVIPAAGVWYGVKLLLNRLEVRSPRPELPSHQGGEPPLHDE